MIINTTQKEMREIASKWIVKDDYVIEIGCNTGNFAALLNKKVKGYTGVDIQEDKISEARIKLPKMNFVNCDIIQNLEMLKNATVVVSFQTLEHIEEDLKILEAVPWGCIVIISVPNSKFKGHVRWFEIEGWRERFSKYVSIHEEITIQNPKKLNKRSFLFRGIRRN